MASYLERAMAAEAELRKMREAVQPIERLLAHSTLIEALLNVAMKHNLMQEFAAENSRLQKMMQERAAPALPADVGGDSE